MTLGELLDQIRGGYARQLSAAAERLRQRPAVRVAFEPALRDQEGTPVREGVLGLPLRVDLAAIEDDAVSQVVSVDSTRVVAFTPLSFASPEGLRVHLAPLRWDALVFRFSAPEGTDWRPLVEWFVKWFREEEGGEAGPLGVVHFLSDPVLDGGEARFMADLGSAPVEAFEELLDAVAVLGVEEVFLGREA